LQIPERGLPALPPGRGTGHCGVGKREVLGMSTSEQEYAIREAEQADEAQREGSEYERRVITT